MLYRKTQFRVISRNKNKKLLSDTDRMRYNEGKSRSDFPLPKRSKAEFGFPEGAKRLSATQT